MGKWKKLSVTWQASYCNSLSQAAIIELLGYVASMSRTDDKKQTKTTDNKNNLISLITREASEV